MASKTLIGVCGLPYAGKSTWVRRFTRDLSRPIPVVSVDHVREALDGARFAAHGEPFVWASAATMVRALFGAGHRVVIVDDIHHTRRRRELWRSLEPEGVQLVWKVISTPPSVCCDRAAAAGDAWLPPHIRAIAAEWEPMTAEDRPLGPGRFLGAA